ncbi:hypothetical protein DICPUDRAFT_42613 [Dictyostelium purpureum]|uniref:Uncharacterized protein n=1 Tax=Dictyostelium purpureum TaxID=5786 RepID=F1A2F7_DICPU|nr:uncharacterized protein DICPUDRAFT_42613 [Dictyostelium purpureum]EGC29621.1 hypothetical protein DICPUDRAFT_42613 [Dictyostelium purpureum]|eukprot:XP_003293854.1 hypothetical protein DICPUDRAFT_42613 [Dictyostelium purpureum]
MKILISTFIILFLLVQSYFPISYYFKLNQLQKKEGYQETIFSSAQTGEEPELVNFTDLQLDTDDERFVWRMFSPIAIDTKCSFEYYNSETFKKINYQTLYFKQWIDLMEMCRKPIIEEISKDLCLKNQNQILLIAKKYYQNNLIMEKRVNLTC